jgi:hypothetical protein
VPGRGARAAAALPLPPAAAAPHCGDATASHLAGAHETDAPVNVRHLSRVQRDWNGF